MVKKRCKCKCAKGSRRDRKDDERRYQSEKSEGHPYPREIYPILKNRELSEEERKSYSLQSKILMDKFKKDFPEVNIPD